MTIALLVGLSAVHCQPARSPVANQKEFQNWETPHVHPLELTPDGTKLLAVNTADNRLEIFDLSSGSPVLAGAIPVGLDPVSVRARSNAEAWVVNHISDSVSVVNLDQLNVVDTLPTDDEPTDVVFAGDPQRAFVSCSQVNEVLVVDPAALHAAPTRLSIQGEDPRAMAVSADGTKVYVAIFESGNRTTLLGGGNILPDEFPPNVVSDAAGPYKGVNPPPNHGTGFLPAMSPFNPRPPAVGLIVRKDGSGHWRDDNQGDWTDFVSGSQAAKSGRPEGWDLVDHDLAIIDTATLSVKYAGNLMNLCMALAVNPANGQVTVVGTDATNEIRYEPNLNGRFLRVNVAAVDPREASAVAVQDLNPHLTYANFNIPPEQRNQSLGDPRGIAWNKDGTRAYVTGMGSNNVAVIDGARSRVGSIPVGEGPTGIVFDGARNRLYVLNKFAATLSVVDSASQAEILQVGFFDPTSAAIKVGRKHMYDTHKNSGLGQLACGACHVDARMDRLAWDLGNPVGQAKSIYGQNLGLNLPGLNLGFQDSHPMKGPMVTQTFQDIIGHEPFHWRADKVGLREFNPAFVNLQGADSMLTEAELQEFKDFLATIAIPPNPYRNFDNTLPADLPLPGHYTTGRFGPAGQPLPNGNAIHGLELFRPPNLLDSNFFACATCHTLPTGLGADLSWEGSEFLPIPLTPQREHHLGLVSIDPTTNATMKIPQLRNLYDKVGCEMTQKQSLQGFGFTHDGSTDSLARFVSQPTFKLNNDQEVADMVAFLLSFSGSELPTGSMTNSQEPLGPTGHDTHAAVGKQFTLAAPQMSQQQQALLSSMFALADKGVIGLIVKGTQKGLQRGYTYLGNGKFQADRASEVVKASDLQARADAGSELTYTVVPKGAEGRIGVDRDGDGFLDRDELDSGRRPDDANSHP